MGGVRFNFVQHMGGRPDMKVFWRVLDKVAQMGWHVVLHLDAQDIVELNDDVLAKIRVPFVIDHMARVQAAKGLDQEPFRLLVALMRGAERVSVGKRPFDDPTPVAMALIDTAPDRVLWGTDFPHPNISKDMPNDGELVDLMFRFCPDEGLRRKLLVDNPARLYDFA